MAVQKIEDLMKQDLPNLVDERRFRRRDTEQVERDEFGRVSYSPRHTLLFSLKNSANGLKNAFPSTWNLFPGSIYARKSLALVVPT